MNIQFKYITLGAIIIFCQILLSEYVNIWPILYIAIFPLFIILLPANLNRTIYMLIAFLLGLCVDITADGVIGLNAASLVAMAYFRDFVLKLTLTKGNLENAENLPVSARTVEIPKLITINLLMLAIFFTVYVLLDSAASFSPLYTILKIVICTAVNCVINLLCNIVLLEKILR